MDRWKSNSSLGSLQKFSQDGSGDVESRYYQFINSTGIVGDGSFVRVKTATLSYQVPEALCTKVKMQSARIYVQGQNLITITGYKGLDPETGYALPPLRMITTGIQFKL
jgi:hypothetical protein